MSVATTNLHTGFALAFSAIILPQLEQYDIEIGKVSVSQSSWIGKIFILHVHISYELNI